MACSMPAATRKLLPLTHALERAKRLHHAGDPPPDHQPYEILIMRFLCALSDAATDNGPDPGAWAPARRGRPL